MKNLQNEVPMFKFILIGVLSVLGLFATCGLVEVNTNGYYKVKQGISGEVSVINETGPFFQNWGTIFEYTNTSTLPYEVRDIRFNDGSVALKITGTVQVRMPSNESLQLKLHRDYRGFDAVMTGLVEALIYASMKQSATLMKAEQFYSSRREEFRSLTENQTKYGIYETYIIDDKSREDREDVRVRIKLDKEGRPSISAKSLLAEYGIEINQLLIDEVKFDEVTEQLIGKRKDAEKAKQDRITAEEQGKAMVAKAEAEKLVEKIQATTDAQKEFEVAEFERKKAEENAKALLATGKAQAEADRLKVIAGLSPKEKAEIDANARVKIAEAMKDLKLPQIMIINNGQNGGRAVDPLEAMGLKAVSDLVNQK